ncbi:MAG: ribose 5-phosphate isomerase B [Anaerolineae bacterium]|nr:ribose 5-phosphate isomerase B [Anaerolineae bacterium]
MKIALAADHAGYPLKQHIVAFLKAQGHEAIDLGVDTAAVPSDYPDSATAIAHALLEGQAERGVLICGSGVGASIAANKYHGIYACVCHDSYSAHQGVEHDRMNVLCMGARIIGESLAEELVTAFLGAHPSEEERHQRRFGKIVAIENENTAIGSTSSL